MLRGSKSRPRARGLALNSLSSWLVLHLVLYNCWLYLGTVDEICGLSKGLLVKDTQVPRIEERGRTRRFGALYLSAGRCTWREKAVAEVNGGLRSTWAVVLGQEQFILPSKPRRAPPSSRTLPVATDGFIPLVPTRSWRACTRKPHGLRYPLGQSV